MITDIFWFSGTGNSLKAAKDIGEIINGNLRSMASEVTASNPKTDAEAVGFVLPVYYLGIPKMAETFIKKLDITRAKYVFVAATRGVHIVGAVISQVKKILIEKGIKLDYGAYITMAENDFTYATVSSEEVQKRRLAAYPARLNKIAAQIKRGKRRKDFELTKSLLNARRKVYLGKTEDFASFYASSEECNGCGICVKLCSENNISLENGRPVWKQNCQICLACFHNCPKKAVSHKGRGEEIPRYRHPEIKINELFARS